MCDGYHVGDDEAHSELEDEFLCEYVDGTMDPVVQEVFEEYVRANPDLREHIECLRHTRLLLCRYGCRCRAPRNLHDQIRRKITCDLLKGGVPFHVVAAQRLKSTTSLSYAVAVLLMLGLVVSVSALESGDRGDEPTSAAVVHAVEHVGALENTWTVRDVERLSLMQPLPYTPRSASVRTMGPARTLVASGIEHEMHAEPRATFIAETEPLFP